MNWTVVQRILGLLLMVFSLMASPASAQPSMESPSLEASTARVQLTLEDADLLDLIRIISRITGRQFIADGRLPVVAGGGGSGPHCRAQRQVSLLQ